MKRHALLVAVFGVLLVGSGFISSFVQSFAKDINDTKENMEIIEDKYNTFKDLLQSFNGDREIVFNDVFNNMFIENLESNYDGWVIKLQDYEMTVNKIFAYKEFLIDYCSNIIYNDSDVQSKCDSMLISYETANNYFVKDINKWNEFVNSYNTQLEDELYKRNLFDLNRDFIDFNDDGEYLGK